MTAPVVGTRYFPASVKALFSLVLSWMVLPYVGEVKVPGSPAGIVLAAGGDLLFGLFLGFSGAVIMSAIETAGYIADVQTGFGLANVIDPHYGQPIPMLGSFKLLLIMLVMLLMDGHHLFIAGLVKSFCTVPAGSAFVPSAWTPLGLKAVSYMFEQALVLSCPVWAASLIVEIALGVLGRSIPQMNVFVVGMPLKAIIGLGMVGASIAFYQVFAGKILSAMSSLLEALLGAF